MDMKFARMFMMIGIVMATGQFCVAQELSKHDQLKIAVQEICPVSGQKLGAHGQPLKVKIGQEEIFLCCRGCLKGKVNPEHWATIHANFLEAQGKCPVMKKPLPANPKWTIVDGQIIYICCPPCTEKIQADPSAYLRQVDQYYTASLRKAQSIR